MQALGVPNAVICSISRIRESVQRRLCQRVFAYRAGGQATPQAAKKNRAINCKGEPDSRGTYGGVHNHNQHGAPIPPPPVVDARSLRPKDHLSHGEPNALSDVVNYAKFFNRSHDAAICVYDGIGNVIDQPEHAGDFKGP